MQEQLRALEARALDELRSATAASLDEWRVRYLGKKGEVTLALRGLGAVPAAERPAIGQIANAVRDALEAAYAARAEDIEQSARQSRAALDITLPGRRPRLGNLHPTTRILREILAVFESLGFRVAEGPEVEWDRYNFELLNIPADHPARDMWDTYYVDDRLQPGKMLLRTHTSPNQARIMERTDPPVRVVVPGKCYRYEAVDATHDTMFYQVEGLAVDTNVTLADLKGTLTAFARAIFGADRRTLFHCSYFPFVEPGVEVAIDCIACRPGQSCRLCKDTGWLEIMGAGMVHPRVLEAVGYDSKVYSGFAFGMGPERVALLKYGIEDIRLFYGNDLRFLRQVR